MNNITDAEDCFNDQNDIFLHSRGGYEKCYQENWVVNIWAINISPAYDMIYINLPIYIKKSFFIIKERLEIGKNDDVFLFILNYKFPIGKKVVNLGWYINCLIPSWICLLRTLYNLTCQNCLTPAFLPSNLCVYCPRPWSPGGDQDTRAPRCRQRLEDSLEMSFSAVLP